MSYQDIHEIEPYEFPPEVGEIFLMKNLQDANPVVAQVLSLIYMNRECDTADLEGVYDIQDYFVKRNLHPENLVTSVIIGNFISKMGEKLPATTASLAAHFYLSSKDRASRYWMKDLTEGFLNSWDSSDSYQIDSLMKILGRYIHFGQTSEELALDGDLEPLMALVAIAYGGVDTCQKYTEDLKHGMKKQLTKWFVQVCDATGYSSAMSSIDKFIGRNQDHLSESHIALRKNILSKPMTELLCSAAKYKQIFGSSYHIFSTISGKLTSSYHYQRNSRPTQVEIDTIVLSSFLAPKNEWRFAFLPGKGNSTDVILQAVASSISEISRHFNASTVDQDLKVAAFSSLLSTAADSIGRKKDLKSSTSDMLIEPIFAHADFDLAMHGITAYGSKVLKNYVTRNRHDLIHKLSQRDRGRALEDNLGL